MTSHHQKFNSEISIAQIGKVLDVIEDNPDVTAREIGAILDLPSLASLRRYLVFLETEGDISSRLDCNIKHYTIAERKARVPACASYKMKANRHFGRTQVQERADAGTLRTATVKTWTPHMFRDPLVAAFYGAAGGAA